MPLDAKSNVSRKNFLLASLPDVELERVQSHLVPTFLELGQVLCESGDKLDYVYFPTTALISLLYIMENGATAEIGVVGNDGILGIALFMGGDTTPNGAKRRFDFRRRKSIWKSHREFSAGQRFGGGGRAGSLLGGSS